MPDERVLVADDEEDIMEPCLGELSLQGYQVRGAHNGFEAIGIAEREDFDLLLTDVRMPGMTGLELFEAVKLHRPDIVGVVITGYGQVDTAIQALKLGMNDFLLKPFSLDDLTAAVGRALESKRLERENARLKALIPLFELSHAFMTLTDVDALVREVQRAALQETGADVAVLMLENEANGGLEVAAATESGQAPHTNDYQIHSDFVLQAVNAQKVIHWQADSQQRRFFPRDSHNPAVTAALAAPLIVQGKAIGILSLARRDGGSPFGDGDAEFLSVLGGQAAAAIQNARLLTRIQNAYQKLSTLDHLKSEFIHITAHELRTPLAIICAHSELLRMNGHDVKSEHLDAINAAVDRLLLHTSNLTTLEFLQAGQIELQRTHFSLPQLLNEVLEQVTPLAVGKRHTTNVLLDDELDEIHADRPKIQAVLQHLLSNAIKFTPDGGTITLQAAAQDDNVHLVVQDTGIGIPSEELEWIFKPFHQLEDSMVRTQGGIGVGLTLAKNLVELHGGRIWVDSAVGDGSAFHFTIPDGVR